MKRGSLSIKFVAGFSTMAFWSIIGVIVTFMLLNNLDAFVIKLAKAEQKEFLSTVGTLKVFLIFWVLISIALGIIFVYRFSFIFAHPLQELVKVLRALAKGDFEQGIYFDRDDEIGSLAHFVQKIAAFLKTKAACLEKLAGGAVDLEVPVASNLDKLGDGLTKLREFQLEKIRNAKDIARGNMNLQIKSASGDDRLAEAMKEIVNNWDKHITTQLNTADKGADLNDARITVDEIIRVAESLENGELRERAQVTVARGVYKEVILAFNNAIDKILAPLNEALNVLEKMAEGDLTQSLDGNYAGGNAKIKVMMNKTLVSTNQILLQVALSVDQVSAGSQQISSSSQSLSQGATEQASSIEEISSSMNEIASQTKQNAENASQANKLASAAKDYANEGNVQMQQMLGAMSEINESSSEISKIIKAIDEIAFQTNLLALNAAVEAARAGAHGKGFAVVAEEVRNLAQRSAKAARETTQLIEDSVKRVDKGTRIAHDTAKALDEIVTQVTKVTDLVGDIAIASEEQSQGISQVTRGLDHIDKVTQANSANAEETASAAQELSGQAAQLKVMISKFKLQNRRNRNYRRFDDNIDMLENADFAEQWIGDKKDTSAPNRDFPEAAEVKSNNRDANNVDPADLIALDDDEFGKF